VISRSAVQALVTGAAIAALVQLAVPIGWPLYDGVVPSEPYRYLAPGSGQAGSPTSYAADPAVSNGRSPQITAATSENPPQAQLIALDGTFAVPAGTPSIHVSITPVAPAAPVPKGAISGNVYRIAVSDPSGASLGLSGDQRPTLAMRGAVPLNDAAIFRYANGTWQQLETIANASLSIYTAQPDGLGDFAVVDLGSGGLTTTDLVIAATVGIVIAALAIWAIRSWRRRVALAAEEAARPRRRVPSSRASSRPSSRPSSPPRRRR
jgi:hypothetical protein